MKDFVIIINFMALLYNGYNFFVSMKNDQSVSAVLHSALCSLNFYFLAAVLQ